MQDQIIRIRATLSTCRTSSTSWPHSEHDSFCPIPLRTLSVLVKSLWFMIIQMKSLTLSGPENFHTKFQVASLVPQDPSFSNQYALLSEKTLDAERAQDTKFEPIQGIGGGTLMMCWIMSSGSHTLNKSRFQAPFSMVISLTLQFGMIFAWADTCFIKGLVLGTHASSQHWTSFPLPID